jgi:hypothetical protein
MKKKMNEVSTYSPAERQTVRERCMGLAESMFAVGEVAELAQHERIKIYERVKKECRFAARTQQQYERNIKQLINCLKV